VGFVVDKVALGQVFSGYFGFPCQLSFHQLLHTHHLSSGAGTIGQILADVPSGLSLTPPREIKKKLYYSLSSNPPTSPPSSCRVTLRLTWIISIILTDASCLCFIQRQKIQQLRVSRPKARNKEFRLEIIERNFPLHKFQFLQICCYCNR
jgi:hypothetical protein